MSRTNTFEKAVSEIRSAARRRLRTQGSVSSVDLTNVATRVKGATRGAVMRTAFRQLETEGVMIRTKATVYNSRAKHSVTVYKRA